MPTLGRPGSLQRLVDNIRDTTASKHQVVFVTEVGDLASARAAVATGATVLVNGREPSYSNAIQTAYEAVRAPVFIAANDDFEFTPGWDEQALDTLAGGALVAGIFDGASGHMAISLVARSYIEDQSGVVDMPNRVFFPYRHNYVDTEFYWTAVKRGVFRESAAVIKHLHPDWGYAVQDNTYLKGQSTLAEDSRTFASRRHLWA